MKTQPLDNGQGASSKVSYLKILAEVFARPVRHLKTLAGKLPSQSDRVSYNPWRSDTDTHVAQSVKDMDAIQNREMERLIKAIEEIKNDSVRYQ